MSQGGAIGGTRLWRPPPLVTSLPNPAYDGQEVYLYVQEGTIWHMRYNAASSSIYKWEFVGGNEVLTEVTTQQTTTSTTYADLATVGPQFTIPFAGDYRFGIGVQSSGTVATAVQYAAIKFGASATVDIDGIVQQPPGNNYVSAGQAFRMFDRTIAAAATVAKVQYKTNAGTATFQNRGLVLRPVRLA